MNHSFNIDVAKQYGLSESIILENIAFWISKNKANEKNYFDGDYWTYNSTRAFKELFPYWTERQIQRILKSLESKDLIKTGNYNKVAYDRTKWYGLTQKAKSIYAKCKMDLQEKGNEFTENVEPIPDINAFVNTDIKSIYTEIFNHYISKDNLTKHKTLTTVMKKAIDKAIKEYKLDKDYLIKIIDRHNKKVESSKKTEYPTKARTLTELFGQKKYNSMDLILVDYLDENYKEIKEKKEKNYDWLNPEPFRM